MTKLCLTLGMAIFAIAMFITGCGDSADDPSVPLTLTLREWRFINGDSARMIPEGEIQQISIHTQWDLVTLNGGNIRQASISNIHFFIRKAGSNEYVPYEPVDLDEYTNPPNTTEFVSWHDPNAGSEHFYRIEFPLPGALLKVTSTVTDGGKSAQKERIFTVPGD